MRIPFIATLDTLIEQLNLYLRGPVTKEILNPGSFGVLFTLPQKKSEGAKESENDSQARLKLVAECLFDARDHLECINWSDESFGMSDQEDRETTSRLDLDHLDERQVALPGIEGHEGLASYVEDGELFGPIMGRHIADVIRGKKTFRAGPQRSREEGRKRRRCKGYRYDPAPIRAWPQESGGSLL